MKRGALIALAILLALALLIVFGSAPLIRAHLYHPRPLTAEAPIWRGPAPQQVSVTTSDGLVLQGYYWPAQGQGDLIVYFHGNGGDQLQAAQGAAPLAAGGHGVLVASYRGYGGNSGSPTEKGLFADGEAWMRLATQLKGAGRLYIFGHSLGGGVAMEMAGRFPIDGLVTFGTFTRIADVAPGWIAPLIPDRFDNLAAITRIKAPVYLFHGTADEVIPYANAAGLRAASGNRATVVTIPGGRHTPPMSQVAPMVWGALAPH